MQAMTNKELEYVIDSMSNEDLLMKTCAAAAAVSTQTELKQCFQQMTNMHQTNYNTLLQALQQHQSVAPMN